MNDSVISEHYDDVEIITPDDGYHYFFAYYDMRATGERGRHLCHRVPFMDHLPTKEDVAEVGYLENRQFFKIGKTTAWNFQQGAMLQYHPFLKDTVYYNVCESGRFYTLTHNFVTGEKKYADRASACISPDGQWGLGINFGRIFDFRPGYGYAGFVDAGKDVSAPKEDGVFLINLERGVSKLLLSYEQIAPIAGFINGEKILINHITFNTDSTHYVMLVRSFPAPGHRSWSTSMLIGDLQGNAYAVLRKTYVSHYHWKNAKEIVAHCTVEGEKKSMYLLNVETMAHTEYDMPYFHSASNGDIHCNFSPDGNYIIGDGYPTDGYRPLLAYSLRTGESRELLRAKTVNPPVIDIRCDLHARFVWGGRAISFDTVHNGRREIALISTDALDF